MKAIEAAERILKYIQDKPWLEPEESPLCGVIIPEKLLDNGEDCAKYVQHHRWRPMDEEPEEWGRILFYFPDREYMWMVKMNKQRWNYFLADHTQANLNEILWCYAPEPPEGNIDKVV